MEPLSSYKNTYMTCYIRPNVLKHDAIHKTGNTYLITFLPKKDRATATHSLHKNVMKFDSVVSEICKQTDK